MLFNYGATLCLLTVGCSGVAARPGPFAPRAFPNTTSSSSTADSSSLTTTQTSLSLSSADSPTTSSSSTSTNSLSSSSSMTTISSIFNNILPATSTSSSITVRTTSTSSTSISSESSTSNFNSTQSLSSSIDSSSISSLSVTSGRNSSTAAATRSSSSRILYVSTTSSRRSPTTTSLPPSTLGSATTTECHPITTLDVTGSRCISYCALTTSYKFAPNTTETVTQLVTLFGNSTFARQTGIPAPTSTQALPLQPCIPHVIFYSLSSQATFTNTGIPTSVIASQGPPTLTVMFVTSKTTVTNFVTAPTLGFGGAGVQDKSTVKQGIQNTNTNAQPSSTLPLLQTLQQGSINHPTVIPTQTPTQTPDTVSPTTIINGVPVILPGSSVIIGGQTLGLNSGTTEVTANGQIFTVNPSQIIAPGTTISRPTPNPGPAPTPAPSPTVINGVTIALGATIAIIDSSTYNIGPGAAPQTAVIHDQTLSIGPNGIKIGSSTLLPPQPGSNPTAAPAGPLTPPPATQIVTIGALTLTEISGSTLLVGTRTFTLSPGAQPTTVVINGQTLSIGPSGVGVGFGGPGGPSGSTTIFQPSPSSNAAANPTQIITAGGGLLTLTEISSRVVIIGTQTFTLGLAATPTTEVLSGSVTVSIGPGGLGIGVPGSSSTLTLAPPKGTAIGVATGAAAAQTTKATGAQFVGTSGAGMGVSGSNQWCGGLVGSVLLGFWMLF